MKFSSFPQEYRRNGPFAAFSSWLKKQELKKDFPFRRCYAEYTGGVSPEPWHYSHIDSAKKYEKAFSLEQFVHLLEKSDELQGRDVLLEYAEKIYENYVSDAFYFEI